MAMDMTDEGLRELWESILSWVRVEQRAAEVAAEVDKLVAQGIVAERERCRQLFLARVCWRIKDENDAEMVRDMLADIDSGEVVAAPLQLMDPDPGVVLPTICFVNEEQ
jgi:hypothetical protein